MFCAGKVNSRVISDWGEKELTAFFRISTHEMRDFKQNVVMPFVKKAVQSNKWLESFISVSVEHDPQYLEFEAEVMKTFAWARDCVHENHQRRAALIRTLHTQVDVVRKGVAYRTKTSRYNERPSQDGNDSLYSGSHDDAQDAPRQSFKEETTTSSDFVTVNELTSEELPISSLHLRLSRRLGGITPTLSYQVFLRSLTADSLYPIPPKRITTWLSFERLDTVAKLYLGFDAENELLAIDYGTKDDPEWLFIQDDASFRSTIHTWHMQHPKTMIIEVLVFDRPGFIPYRTVADLAASKDGEEDEEDEDEDEDEDEIGSDDEAQDEEQENNK